MTAGKTMTINLALEYIPRRMQELGHGKHYHLRFRHLLLQAQQTLEVDAYNQIYLLVEEAEDINIESESGTFDLSLQNINEFQYEHQGKIIIENQSTQTRHVRFIQIVPLRKQK